MNTTAIYSFVDYLMSGLFVRSPNLKVMYSEGQAGWLPFMLDRVDIVWEENRAWGGVADKVPNPPSSYVRDHVYFCVFQDKVAFENLDSIPVENLTYEVDYPHSDSTWPRSKELAEKHMAKLTQELLIVGLPRTGSSILHELMAQDPENRTPMTWEVKFPCPPPETARRLAENRVYDLQFDDFIADPIGQIALICRHFGRTLSPAAAHGMREFLVANPGDKFAKHRYRFAATELDPVFERRRFAHYQERFAIASERVT